MEVEGEFMFACSIDSDSTDAIAEFLEQSVRGVCLQIRTLFPPICVCVCV